MALCVPADPGDGHAVQGAERGDRAADGGAGAAEGAAGRHGAGAAEGQQDHRGAERQDPQAGGREGQHARQVQGGPGQGEEWHGQVLAL